MKGRKKITLILIILVLIIIGITIGIKCMNKETNEPKKESNVPQLQGEFYSIENITKDWIENEQVTDYRDFEFDLDNDGNIDKITLRYVGNENEETYHTLEFEGKTIYSHWQGAGATVGIVDIDENDSLLEIWVYDDGPSDDPCYYFYRKVGNEIIQVGSLNVENGFWTDGKGRIVAADRNMPWVKPAVYNCYYTIEDNKFKSHSLDFSNNNDYEYIPSNGFFTDDLENLRKFEQDNSSDDDLMEKAEKYNIKQLEENTKIKIIEFVDRANEYAPQDLKVELSDGTVGYLIHPYGRIYIYD